jgi:hypothetical protein
MSAVEVRDRASHARLVRRVAPRRLPVHPRRTEVPTAPLPQPCARDADEGAEARATAAPARFPIPVATLALINNVDSTTPLEAGRLVKWVTGTALPH